MQLKHHNGNQLPLLDFDSSTEAIIQPRKEDFDFSLPARCVPTFFRDIVDDYSFHDDVQLVGSDVWETGEVHFYKTIRNDKEIGFYHTWVGAPISAGLMEMAIAMGSKVFLACGGCGVIDDSILDQGIIVPYSGIRDEGTSFHYAAPSKEIFSTSKLFSFIKKYMTDSNLPFASCKTWTTDGFYRETADKMKKRLAENCSIVEMEYTALCAVAQLRNIEFGELLYSGDILFKEDYDDRNWQGNISVRKQLFEICLDAISKYDL